MKQQILFVLVVLAAPTVGAVEDQLLSAAPVDEALKMQAAGVEEAVVLEWVKARPAFAELDAAAVKRLRDGKIPEAVVQAMIHRGGLRPELGYNFVRTYDVPRIGSETSKAILTPLDYELADRPEALKDYQDLMRYVYREPFPFYRYVYLTPSCPYSYPYSYYRPPPYYYPLHSFLYGANRFRCYP